MKGTKRNEEAKYIHRGIPARSFDRRFTLEDSIEVKHAEFLRGLLVVDLRRTAPAVKAPVKIEIESPNRNRVSLVRTKVA